LNSLQANGNLLKKAKASSNWGRRGFLTNKQAKLKI